MKMALCSCFYSSFSGDARTVEPRFVLLIKTVDCDV